LPEIAKHIHALSSDTVFAFAKAKSDLWLLKFRRVLLSFNLAVSVNDFAVTPRGLSDWHAEVLASPRNQKIGSP
jgi:hypothetical protein